MKGERVASSSPGRFKYLEVQLLKQTLSLSKRFVYSLYAGTVLKQI